MQNIKEVVSITFEYDKIDELLVSFSGGRPCILYSSEFSSLQKFDKTGASRKKKT